ncbi:MAG: hypothetical protein HY760_08470 [Nitrospirae bacterium]|nr:hypothetical protein [Nitrospirota bacterium]
MTPGSLSPEELAALQVTRPFLIRSGVIPKILERFSALREAIRNEIPASGLLAPDALDLNRFQIAKGDYHEGLPFAFLDFPQYFSREVMFTYRAFFWWGHPFALAAILKGPLLGQYQERLMSRYPEMADRGFHLSLAPDPWDWYRGDPHTLELTSANRDRLIDRLPSLDYLKLLRFVISRSSGLSIWNRWKRSRSGSCPKGSPPFEC